MYNGEGYIENIICAIENQDFKDIEIIIIDDKSKDNSVQKVKELMKKTKELIYIKIKKQKEHYIQEHLVLLIQKENISFFLM